MSLSSRISDLATAFAQQIRSLRQQVGTPLTDAGRLIDAYSSYTPLSGRGQVIDGTAHVVLVYDSIPNGAGVGVMRVGWRPAVAVPVFTNMPGVAATINTTGTLTVRGTATGPVTLMAVYPVV